MTISEGIGGGVIMNGQLVRGSTGAAGEFGHMALVEDGLDCRCGNRGCWEVYASNTAAIRYYAQSNSPGRVRRAGLASLESVPTFNDVLRLAEQGDARAIEAIETMAHYIGAGTAMLVTGLAPDAIVLVGEVTRLWSRIGPIIDKAIKERCFTHSSTRIVPADPVTQPRLRGTIALVLQKHFGAPSVA
jgi:predicted NBD/HSP70 family sugar kinase